MIADPVARRLVDFYFYLKPNPAWLAWCYENGFAAEELTFLEQIAVEYEPLDKASGIEKWLREVEKAGGIQVYSANTNSEKISILSNLICRGYLGLQDLLDRDVDYVSLNPRIVAIQRLERIRSGYVATLRHTQNASDKNPDALLDSEIVRARAVPLEKLVPDLNKFGYTLCRWHDDHKPSMLIKNGFAYCFSCGAWADSVKWLMDVEHLDFKAAVRALNRIG